MTSRPDSKGEFILADRRYGYRLTITDFATRYLISCGALTRTEPMYAFAVFERTFQEFRVSSLEQHLLVKLGGPGLRAFVDTVPDRASPRSSRPSLATKASSCRITTSGRTASSPATAVYGSPRIAPARFLGLPGRVARLDLVC